MKKEKLVWITERHKSGTIWNLYINSFPGGISIFKSRNGYVLNQDEYPTFNTLQIAKKEAIKRMEKK